MKQKITIKDKDGNSLKSGEVNSRNLLHFDVQKSTRATKIESKKIYNRKKIKKVSDE